MSWQVTGIRKDPFAMANPIIPETNKPLNEVGALLYTPPIPQSGFYINTHKSKLPEKVSNSIQSTVNFKR